MKLMHLADLHIGKSILEQSLLEDQEYMLNQILDIIEKEKVEVVLIAGDVYDRTVPSSEAVELLDNFLNQLIKNLKVKVFMISGNHDSKERLGFGNKIFENDGLYIQTTYEGEIRKIVLEDEYGNFNIYMMPFIKPIDVKKYFDVELDSYDDAFKHIVEKEKINENERNIIMVHQFVTNSGKEPDRCDSETLIIGGTENIDVSHFDKFDYVALRTYSWPSKSKKRYSKV